MTTPRSGTLFRILFVSLALALLMSACGGSTSDTPGGGVTCEFGGQSYSPGDSFPAGDGCNTCTCGSDGSVGCTMMGCANPGCQYQGQHFSPGQDFPAGDGCNTCTCQAGGDIACTEALCLACSYNGQDYAPGDTFPATDSCNTCTCQADGSVSCTEINCPTECVYAGKTYKNGESFPALDGCNTCTCTPQGVGCTKVGCACDPKSEWWRKYVADSPAACATIKFACEEHTTPFFNDCGCGCEQSSSCPEWFNCMPPSPCDGDAMKKCPFSGIAY